jgi:hypothetical protein
MGQRVHRIQQEHSALKTLILRAEMVPLTEMHYPKHDYRNVQDIYFSDAQLMKMPNFATISAFLRRHPSNGMLKMMRDEFLRSSNLKNKDTLIFPEEVAIEQALDLHVIRGFYSWSMLMLSMKDGHMYDHNAGRDHVTAQSRFTKLEPYEKWLHRNVGQTNQRVSLGDDDDNEKRDDEINSLSSIHSAFY